MTSWPSAWCAILATTLISACTQPGDFCDVYSPTRIDSLDHARDLVALDRAAAEALAANQAAWSRCP